MCVRLVVSRGAFPALTPEAEREDDARVLEPSEPPECERLCDVDRVRTTAEGPRLVLREDDADQPGCRAHEEVGSVVARPPKISASIEHRCGIGVDHDREAQPSSKTLDVLLIQDSRRNAGVGHEFNGFS